MKKSKLYAKKTLSVFMAVMMLMSAWVFIPGEHNHASAASATNIESVNTNKVLELSGLDFGTGFTTTSGNFHGDNASTMASRGYYKNVLYSPHFPASNNNLTNNDAGVYFGNLGNTADGARVWYPETTLIYDGVTTPQIPILFDIDSNNNNRVGVKNVYISSGANGLSFNDSYWTAKSECAKDTNYYTHFTFDWIMQNNSGNYWISTSSGNDKESKCSKNGYWDIYATYLQYTGGSFGSGSTYYKAITPTWVCRTGSNYTGTTRNTIYVIDYVPLKNALSSVQGIINSIKSDPAKYTTDSVSAFVEAAKKLVAAKPNNYINSGKNDVSGWNTAVSSALSAWNSAKNLTVQTYTLEFVNTDGEVKHTQTSAYGTPVNCTDIAAGLGNTIKQYNEQYHQTYKWDLSNAPSSIVDDVTITETPSGTAAHQFGDYVQGNTDHTRTCSVCGYVQTQDHIKGTGYVTKAETCTEDGVMTYDCSICGKKAIETAKIDNITGHDFNEIVIKQSGVDGSHWRKCSRCDAYGWAGVENACEDHNWDKNADGNVDANDAISSKASTCEEAGYETYECKVCKDTYKKTLELAKHKITATAAKDVTNICGGDGNAAFWTCSVCKRVWKDAGLTDELENTTDADNDGIPDELEVKGPDHDFTGAYVNVKNGAEGTHYRQCKRFTQCGKYGLMVNGVAVEGATEAHKFTSTETASTCTVQGTKTYTCSDCNHSYSEKLPLAAHKMTKHEAVKAECNKPGNIEYYSCSECNKNYKDAEGTVEATNTVIPALEHKWSAPHDYDTPNTAATCQKPALYNQHCDYCKIKLSSTYEYGKPDTVNGHKFQGEIKQNADGTHSYKCTVEGCTEYGNPTTCEFTVPIEDVASTCHTYGYTITKCKTCGKENKVEKTALDSDNHAGGTEVRSATEAKCNTDGYTGDTYCLGCNTKIATGKTITADPKVHPHEDMKIYDAKSSTCQTEGWKEYKYCSACGTYEVEKEAIAKKAHKFTNYVTNNNGTHTAVCDTCDEAVAPRATDTKDCYGGEANCVDKAICSACNTAYGNVNSANHKSVKTMSKVPATCQTEGTEAYRYCEACNTALEEIVKIEKAPHQFGAWTKVEGKDEHTRSCTTCDADVGDGIAKETEPCNGGTAYCNALAKCSDCKAEYGSLDKNNHSTEANTLKDVVEATCQAPGFSGNYRYNCCDAIKEAGKKTEQLAHKFDIEVENSRKAATCIETGEVIFKCSTCVEGEGITAATNKQILPVDAKNHASSETVEVGAKPATCEEDGRTADVYYKCCYDETPGADNKKALKEKGTVIKANGQHVYTEAVAEYMLVLGDDGKPVIVETKDDEGNVISKALKLKDKEPDYAAKIAARRDDNKWYHVELCTICNAVTYTACYTYEHTYNCTDTDECEICSGLCSLKDADKHKDELVEIKDDAKAATCVENGMKSYYMCEDCGKTYFDASGKRPLDLTKDEDRAALVIDKSTVAHTINWDVPDETVEGNCGSAGYKLYKCSVDGCTYETTVDTGVASNKHDWAEDYTVIDEPTCGANGYKAIKCEICKTVKPNSYVIIPATGEHNYDKNKDGMVNRKDAEVTEGKDCQEPGTLTYTCQNEGCTYTKTEIDTEGVSAHKWGEWITIGGDCSTGVKQERTCSACNATEHRLETTDAHQFELVVRVEPTTEADGYEIKKCKNCGLEERIELPFNGSGSEGGEGSEGGSDAEEDKHQYDASKYRVVEAASCKSAEIREYTCVLCGEKIRKPYGDLKDHVWLEQAAEKPTCEKGGHNAYYKCVRCEETLGYKGEKEDDQYKPLGHNDGNKDGKCDRCGSHYYNGGESICNCLCHSTGFMGFIYKIARFFWKLFGINPTCGCGVDHY